MLRTFVHPHYFRTVSNLVFVHVAWYNYVIVAGIVSISNPMSPKVCCQETVHLVVTICVFLFTLFLY